MKMQRRTFLAASLTALASTASLTVRAAAGAPKTAFVISVSGSMDGPAAKSWGKLTGELPDARRAGRSEQVTAE